MSERYTNLSDEQKYDYIAKVIYSCTSYDQLELCCNWFHRLRELSLFTKKELYSLVKCQQDIHKFKLVEV
jgi:transcriptional antiterminator Rof (Rho-off)